MPAELTPNSQAKRSFSLSIGQLTFGSFILVLAVIIVTSTASVIAIRHIDSTFAELQRLQSVGDPIDGQIHGIADVPNGDAWAVGDDGRGAALLWYHGGYWRIFRATAKSGAGA